MIFKVFCQPFDYKMVVNGWLLMEEWRNYVWWLTSKITNTMSSPSVFACIMTISTDCVIILVETIKSHKIKFFFVIVIATNIIKSITKNLFKIKVLIISIKTNIIKSFILPKNLFRVEFLNKIKSITIFMKHHMIKFFIIAIIINIINFIAIFMRLFDIKFFIVTIIINSIAIIAIINILKLLFKDMTKFWLIYNSFSSSVNGSIFFPHNWLFLLHVFFLSGLILHAINTYIKSFLFLLSSNEQCINNE